VLLVSVYWDDYIFCGKTYRLPLETKLAFTQLSAWTNIGQRETRHNVTYVLVHHTHQNIIFLKFKDSNFQSLCANNSKVQPDVFHWVESKLLKVNMSWNGILFAKHNVKTNGSYILVWGAIEMLTNLIKFHISAFKNWSCTLSRQGPQHNIIFFASYSMSYVKGCQYNTKYFILKYVQNCLVLKLVDNTRHSNQVKNYCKSLYFILANS